MFILKNKLEPQRYSLIEEIHNVKAFKKV